MLGATKALPTIIKVFPQIWMWFRDSNMRYFLRSLQPQKREWPFGSRKEGKNKSEQVMTWPFVAQSEPSILSQNRGRGDVERCAGLEPQGCRSLLLKSRCASAALWIWYKQQQTARGGRGNGGWRKGVQKMSCAGPWAFLPTFDMNEIASVYLRKNEKQFPVFWSTRTQKKLEDDQGQITFISLFTEFLLRGTVRKRCHYITLWSANPLWNLGAPLSWVHQHDLIRLDHYSNWHLNLPQEKH